MNEKDVLISHCLDLKKYSSDNCVIQNTGFLSADEVSTVKVIERELNSDTDTFYFGGYDDAERVMAVFVPKIYGVQDLYDYLKSEYELLPLSLLRIKKDRFSQLSHRDYLGSLMGLGLKRETLGDIIITDEYTYVFADNRVCDYICENLKKAGRGTLVCEKCNISEFNPGIDKTEIVFSSVASLRLDNVLSAGFNLSRSSAANDIKSGIVYVNSEQILKPDYLIREKDKIVLRGKGKINLDTVIGTSKKGRIHINIKKYK